MKNISQVILLSTSCLIWYGADNVCASVNVFSGIPKSGTHNTLHTTPYLAYPHLPHLRGERSVRGGMSRTERSAMLTSCLPEESNHYIRVASVCFITDTGACSGEKFSNDETPGNGSGNPGGIPDYDTPQEQCQAAGYGVTSCPAGSHGDNPCPADSSYYQKCVCDANMTQTCTKPYYGVGPSCDGKYASCKRDDAKACKEDGYGQTAQCSSVQTPNKKCSYNSGYYDKCVCRSDLVTCTYPQSGVGEACGGKYASCQCPGSYKSCECGGAAGATSCTVNGQTTYSSCKSCCSAEYIYDSSNCPAPHKLTGDVCNGKYKQCELDENNITCANFTMPKNASYLKLVYSCDDLTSAINSGKTGNIVLMKTLTCPTSLTLKSGQNLVSIGYFLKLTSESNDYKNQLNQCYTLTLNNYLYTSDNTKVSDITLLNTPLYLKGSTDIRNMNMKVTNGYNAITALSKNFSSTMSGIVNIYTNAAVAVYGSQIIMNDTKLNLRPIGTKNRGFYKSNITINGDSIVNINVKDASGNGEAFAGTTTNINDNAIINITSNQTEVEAFNGHSDDNDGATDNFTYINSPNAIIRAQITGNRSYTFIWKPYFKYTSGCEIMTISGYYKASASASNYFSGSGTSAVGSTAYGTDTPSGSWTRIGKADFSSTSEFGRQMKIFETNFFK